MPTADYIRAHRHSYRNRDEVLASAICGCFHCLDSFRPTDVEKWTDVGKTAVCPNCQIDSVIGDESGYPVTREFLKRMQLHWFDDDKRRLWEKAT